MVRIILQELFNGLMVNAQVNRRQFKTMRTFLFNLVDVPPEFNDSKIECIELHRVESFVSNALHSTNILIHSRLSYTIKKLHSSFTLCQQCLIVCILFLEQTSYFNI
jgi:hypothetical protein